MPTTRENDSEMPRMQGAAVQCCMCITGVFMFLGGLIMLATGICLILNYGVFDVKLLPPDLQNDEGKKTVGIILTSCGLVAVLISVIVSLLYLCNKTKSPVVIPDDLARLQSSARTQTPERYDRFRVDRADRVRSDRSIPEKERRTSTGKLHGATNGGSRPQVPTKSIPGSTEVVHPRHYKKRHKKYPRRRLEEIKEQDAISRKTTEGTIAASEIEHYNDTPRSGSFSSEMTNDERMIPKVVLDHHDDRRPSNDSASTTQTATSDTSNFRPPDTDKSRRELQFIPSTVNDEDSLDGDGRDSVSILQKEDSTVVYNRGLESEDSSIVSGYNPGRTLESSSSNNTTDVSAGGIYTQPDSAQMKNREVTYNENDLHNYTTPSDDLSLAGETNGYTTAELPHQSDRLNSLPS